MTATQRALVEALTEVWNECVSARNDRIIGASDDSPGCRPRISGELMQKMYAALITNGVDAPLCYGNKRNAAGDAALALARAEQEAKHE